MRVTSFFIPVLQVLLFSLIPPTADLRADDGYRMWLRYERIDDTEILQNYRAVFKRVILNESSETMTAVKAELHEGLGGLLSAWIRYRFSSR
jgi:alpha-glucuronidase